MSHTDVLKISLKRGFTPRLLHSFHKIFDSTGALTRPYAAPSVLHIALRKWTEIETFASPRGPVPTRPQT